MSRNTLLAYSNKFKKIEIYTNVNQYTVIVTVDDHFLQLKLTKPYKVYGNDKIKSKHRKKFKKIFKIYKSLTKIYINSY